MTIWIALGSAVLVLTIWASCSAAVGWLLRFLSEAPFGAPDAMNLSAFGWLLRLALCATLIGVVLCSL